jgi:KDO2-lipid IV(A) lauroyltransferase
MMIKKIRYLIEALALLIFFIISKILPVTWASNFGGWVGRTIGSRLAASRKAYTNLKFAIPSLSDTEIKRITSGMWDNLGRVMMEYPHLSHIGRDRTEIIGLDILEKYRGKPAIILSGHLANWECCPPALLLQSEFNASPIYRAPNNPFSDAMLQYARTLAGKIKTIPKSRSGTRHIVKAMNDGMFVGMLIDQKYNEGVAVDFFGKPAMTSPIFVQLAQKFNCPVIPLRIERIKGCNFRIIIEEPLKVEDKTAEEIIGNFNARLETWIKDKPEQWLWLHKRWGKIND